MLPCQISLIKTNLFLSLIACLLTWNEIEGCKHDIPLIEKSKFDQLYCIDMKDLNIGGSWNANYLYYIEFKFIS